MSDVNPERDNLAERLDDVLRRFERRGGDLNKLAHDCGGHTRADFLRWRKGTTIPGEVLVALIDELPTHLANELIGTTQYRLAHKIAMVREA